MSPLLVHRRIQKIHLTVRYLFGFASTFTNKPDRSVCVDALANIYMNRFLKYWRLCRCGEVFRGHVIAYADDCDKAALFQWVQLPPGDHR